MKEKYRLTGKDVITIGIFSAIYFVLNFIAMIGGVIPILWILLPGTTAILTGVPYLMMVTKVRKPGAVMIMGLITAVLYFVTGQFTILILITMLAACVLAEIVRFLTKYENKLVYHAVSFVLFSYGMLGSPAALFVYRDSFLNQIAESMGNAYAEKMTSFISAPMLTALCVSPIIGGIIGILIAVKMFNKHFKKAGVV